jgi:hypothetical protein
VNRPLAAVSLARLAAVSLARLAVLVAVLVAALAAATPASAQDVAPEDGSAPSAVRARELFEQANAAADREDFVRARAAFEESLSLLPRPATALNLAQVLRSMGSLRECTRVLEALDRGDYGAVSDRVRDLAGQLAAEAAHELASVELRVEGADQASVRIDADEPIEVRAAEPSIAVLDPGEHLVVARTGDGRSVEQSLRLTVGESRTLRLEMPPLVPVRDTPAEGPDLAWLGWTLGGVALAGVIVAVVLGVVLSAPSRDAVTDATWGQASALHW